MCATKMNRHELICKTQKMVKIARFICRLWGCWLPSACVRWLCSSFSACVGQAWPVFKRPGLERRPFSSRKPGWALKLFILVAHRVVTWLMRVAKKDLDIVIASMKSTTPCSSSWLQMPGTNVASWNGLPPLKHYLNLQNHNTNLQSVETPF